MDTRNIVKQQKRLAKVDNCLLEVFEDLNHIRLTPSERSLMVAVLEQVRASLSAVHIAQRKISYLVGNSGIENFPARVVAPPAE